MDNDLFLGLVNLLFVCLAIYKVIGLLGRRVLAGNTWFRKIYTRQVMATADKIARNNVYTKYITWFVQAYLLFYAFADDNNFMVFVMVVYIIASVVNYLDAKKMSANLPTPAAAQ